MSLPLPEDLPTELLIRLALRDPDAFLAVLHGRPTRPVLERAIALTGDPDPARRELGVRILRELGPESDTGRPFRPETVPVLRARLAVEPDPCVLGWLISALGYHAAREALPEVLARAGHPDTQVRFFVAAALPGLVHPVRIEPEATAALLTLARDEDDDIRFYALYALTEEVADPDPEALAALTAYLADDPDPQIRELAVEHRTRRGGM